MRGIALGVVVLSQVTLPPGWQLPPWPTALPQVPMPSAQLPTPPAGPPIVFAKNELTFKARGGAAKVTLLDKDGEDGWVSPDQKTMLTAYAHDAKLHNGGKPSATFKTGDVLDAAFSADSSRIALVQAQSPLTVRSLPDGALIWQRPQGSECGARFKSPTELTVHGWMNDARLVKITLGPMGATETPIGPKIRAGQCWATPDGKKWIVADDIKYQTFLIDGDTGASSVLASGYTDSPIGSPVGDRFCAIWPKERELRCFRPGSSQVELLYKGNSKLDPSGITAFDDTGTRMMFEASETKDESTYEMVTYVADFAAQTVTAMRGVKLLSGGSMRLLSGGHGIVGGSKVGVTWWDLDAKTVLAVPGAGLYSVRIAQGLPRSLFAARESTTSGAKQGVNLIELPK
ncbi:MAG: hypothetical protein ACXVEE_03035 [Polyangiales bacterium]